MAETSAVPVALRAGSSGYLAAGIHRVVAPAVAAVTALAGTATVVLVLVLPLGYDGEDVAGRLAATAFVVGMVGLAAVGAVLARRRVVLTMAWLLLLTGLTGALARANMGVALGSALWAWPIETAAAWLTNWTWVPAQVLAMIVLLRFPDGRHLSARWVWWERVVLLWGAVTVVATAFYPGALGAEALAPRTNPMGAEPLAWLLDPALSIAFGVMPVLVLGSVAALGVRWRTARADVRQQLGVVAAVTALLAVASPFALFSRNGQVLEGLAYLALPAAIAVAVLRYRLWDLGPVLRRSVVYAAASATLAALYLGTVALLDVAVGERGALAAMLAAATVALVAVPVRSASQLLLDRLLYGYRRDPYKVVRDLGARLESAGPDLLSTMCEELLRSLRVPYVAVELVDGRVLAAAGHPVLEGGRVGLSRSGTLLGHLVVGRRGGAEPLTGLDLHLLEDLAGHAGTAVQAALLDAELRDSYERLRVVREHERGRLRRELHDGLGPVLGAVTMRAEAARNMVRSGRSAEEVDQVLEGVGTGTELAVREVRRLLDDLVPSVLVERGLRQALVDFVESYLHGIHVRMELPCSLPQMPAEVEVAVYRVVGEALRNAARHSGGRTCTVRMSVDGRKLAVAVQDDGRGMGGADAGIGIKGMRERIQALGGRLEILPGDDRVGVIVRAELPRDAV